MRRMILIERWSHVKGQWHERSRSVWGNKKEGHMAGGGGPGRGDCSVLQMRKLRAWLPSPLLFLLLKCCPRKVTPGSGQVLRWRAWLVGHLGLPVSTVESAQRPGEGHPGAACGEGAAAGVHPDRPPSAPQLRGPPHALHHFWGWRYGLPHHPLHGA